MSFDTIIIDQGLLVKMMGVLQPGKEFPDNSFQTKDLGMNDETYTIDADRNVTPRGHADDACFAFYQRDQGRNFFARTSGGKLIMVGWGFDEWGEEIHPDGNIISFYDDGDMDISNLKTGSYFYDMDQLLDLGTF